MVKLAAARANRGLGVLGAAASTAMCTPLVPLIGYARASGLAQRALAENRPLADLVVAEGLMSAADFAALERAACAV